MATDAQIRLEATLDTAESVKTINQQLQQIENSIDPIKIDVNSTEFKQATEQIKNSIKKIGELSRKSFTIDTDKFNVALQAFNQANNYLVSLQKKQSKLKQDSAEYAQLQNKIRDAFKDRTALMDQLKSLAETDLQKAKLRLVQDKNIKQTTLQQVDAYLKASVAQDKAVKNQQKLNDEVKKTAVTIANTTNKIELMSSKYGDLVIDGKRVSETANQLKTALQNATNAQQVQEVINKFNDLNGKIRVAQEQTKLLDFKKLQNEALDKIEQDFQDIINKMPSLQSELNLIRTKINGLQSTNGIKNLTTQVNTFRNQVKQSVPQLTDFKQRLLSIVGGLGIWTSATQALRGFIMMMRNGIGIAKEYDEVLTDVAITTGFTSEQTKELTKLIFEQSQALGANAKVTAEIAKTYANASSSVEDLGAQMEAAAMLANIANLSAKEAVDTIQGVTQQFQIDDTVPENLARIDDILVSVSSSLQYDFAGGIQSISAAIQKGGAVAKDAGFSFEEFAATIGTVVEKTRLSGETVGTAFRTIAARLGRVKDEVEGTAQNVSKAEEAFRSVGIELRDSTEGFRDLPDVLGELATKWDSLSETQRAYVAEQAAGVRQISIFKTLMNNYAQTVELATQAENSQGAALIANQEKYESVTGYVNRLESAWDQLWATTANSTFIKSVIQFLTNVLNLLNEINEVLGGSLLPTLTTITALVTSAKLISAVTGLYTTITAGATAAAGANTALATSSGGVIAGIKGITVALASSGWGLAIIAIGAVVGGVVALTDALTKSKKELEAERVEHLKKIKTIKEEKDALKTLVDEYENDETSTARQIEITKQLANEYEDLNTVLDEHGNVIFDVAQAKEFLAEKDRQLLQVEEDLLQNARELFANSKGQYDDLVESLENVEYALQSAIEGDLTFGSVKELQETRDHIINEIRTFEAEYSDAFDAVIKLSAESRERFKSEINLLQRDYDLSPDKIIELVESFDEISGLAGEVATTGSEIAKRELDTVIDSLNELSYISLDTSEIIYDVMIQNTLAVSENAKKQAESVEAAFESIEKSAETLVDSLNEDLSNIKTLDELLKQDSLTEEDMLELVGINPEVFSQLYGESTEVIKEAIRAYRQELEVGFREGTSTVEAFYNETFQSLMTQWGIVSDQYQTIAEVNGAFVENIATEYADQLANLDQSQGDYWALRQEIVDIIDSINQAYESMGIPVEIGIEDVLQQTDHLNELNKAIKDVGITKAQVANIEGEQIIELTEIHAAKELGRELLDMQVSTEARKKAVDDLVGRYDKLIPILQSIGRQDLVKDIEAKKAAALRGEFQEVEKIAKRITTLEMFPKKPENQFAFDVDYLVKRFDAAKKEAKSVEGELAGLEKNVNNLATNTKAAAKDVNTNVNSEYANMFSGLNKKYATDNVSFKSSQDKNIVTARNTASGINKELSKVRDVNVDIKYNQINKPIGITSSYVPTSKTSVSYKMFAEGGVIEEPTLAMVGEDPNSNPEVILNNRQISDLFKISSTSAIQEYEKTRELYEGEQAIKSTSSVAKSTKSYTNASSQFTKIEFDRYKKLNEELEIYEDRLKKIEKLKDTSTQQDNLKLLNEEIELYHKQEKVISELAITQRKELGEIKAELANLGFTVINDEISNYNKLQDMVNKANKTGSESAKEQAENAEELIDSYYNLKNSIRDLEVQYLDLNNTIDELQFESLIYATELVNENLEEQFELLEYNLKLLDDNEYAQRVSLLIDEQQNRIVKRAELQAALAEIERKLREGLLPTSQDNINKLKELQKEVRGIDVDIKNLGDSINKELKNAFDSLLSGIEDDVQFQRDNVKSLLEEVNDAYKERKDILDEEIDVYEKAINLQIELLKTKQEESSYEKETQELYEKRQELLQEIDKLSLDTSFTAKKERDKLQEELAKLDDKLTERQEKQRIKVIEEGLKDELEMKEKAAEEELTNMEHTIEYNNETLTMRHEDMVKFLENEEKVLDEFYEELTSKYGTFAQFREMIANSEYKNLADGFKTLESDITESSNTIGQQLTNNIINKIKEMQGLLGTAIGFEQTQAVTDIVDVVSQMQKNSAEWQRTSDQARRDELARRNLDLGQSIGATRTASGVWLTADGQNLYDVASGLQGQLQIVDVVEQMRRNSEEWINANATRRQDLADVTLDLGQSLGANRDDAGVWWLNGQKLYDYASKVADSITSFGSLFNPTSLLSGIGNQAYDTKNNVTLNNTFNVAASNGELSRTELEQASTFMFDQMQYLIQD